MIRYHIDEDFDKLITTNKYDVCNDECVGVVSIKLKHESWMKSKEIPLDIFSSIIIYNNFEDLIHYLSEDDFNSKIDKILSLKLILLKVMLL